MGLATGWAHPCRSLCARNASGQPVLSLARGASRLLTLLLAIIVGAIVLALGAAGGVVWRLNQGPMDVTAVTRRLLPMIDPDLTAGQVTLALGQVDAERVLRVGVTDATRAATEGRPADTVQSAAVAVALSPLLAGRIEPEEIVASGVSLHVRRGGSGKPGGDPARLLSRLRHVLVSDVQVVVADGALGQSWSVAGASVALDRAGDGSLAGTLMGKASIGDVSAILTVAARSNSSESQVHATLSPVSPAALARAVPRLAALQAVDAAIGLQVDATFGPAMTLVGATIHAEAGPGVAQIPAQGGGASPAKFDSMVMDAEATPKHATLRALRLVLPSPSGARPSTLVLSGTADRADGRFEAHLAADLDQAAFADLPVLWPPRVGGNARAWLTANLTAGTAHDGHVAFTLAGAETGDGIDLVDASGSLTGDDVTAWWLRPVPPLQHGHAVVTWQNADTVQIAVAGAKQGGLVVNAGGIRITGLTGHDQVAAIDADIVGPLGDLFTLLAHPRLKLLSKHPIPITGPAGAVAAHLTVKLPLDSKVSVDQVAIHAAGQVANTHLGAVAAGRDLDRGQLAFDVTNDGLKVSGTGQLDHVPGTLAIDMDFRAGAPAQVVQHAAVTLRLGERDARAAGLAAVGLDAGAMVAKLDYAERRDGGAILRVSADLREAGFKTPLGWSKAVGTPGHLEGEALLTNGKLVGLERLRAEAPGLSIEARSDLVGGVPAIVHIQRGEIGSSSATGTIALPQRDGEPYRVSLSGPRLDLEGQMKGTSAPGQADRGNSPARFGTPYAVDLRFQQVMFGPGRSLGPRQPGGARRWPAPGISPAGDDRAGALAGGPGLRRHRTEVLGDRRRSRPFATQHGPGDRGCRRHAHPGRQFRRPVGQQPVHGHDRPAQLPGSRGAGRGQGIAGAYAVRAGGCLGRARPGVRPSRLALPPGWLGAGCGGRPCLQRLVGRDCHRADGFRPFATGPEGNHRAGLLLQRAAWPGAAAGPPVQPGEGWRRVRRQLRATWLAVGPERDDQPAFGSHARLYPAIVRPVQLIG